MGCADAKKGMHDDAVVLKESELFGVVTATKHNAACAALCVPRVRCMRGADERARAAPCAHTTRIAYISPQTSVVRCTRISQLFHFPSAFANPTVCSCLQLPLFEFQSYIIIVDFLAFRVPTSRVQPKNCMYLFFFYYNSASVPRLASTTTRPSMPFSVIYNAAL